MLISSKVTSSGQVTIPKVFRKNNLLSPGDVVEFTETKDGLLLRSINKKKEKSIQNILEILQKNKNSKTNDDKIMKLVNDEIRKCRKSRSSSGL